MHQPCPDHSIHRSAAGKCYKGKHAEKPEGRDEEVPALTEPKVGRTSGWAGGCDSEDLRVWKEWHKVARDGA